MRSYFASQIGVIAIGILVMIGYISNIVKLLDCDFDAPYKSEAIRIVGILVPPVGVFTGYMELKDSKDVQR